jgi:hypothetical protein
MGDTFKRSLAGMISGSIDHLLMQIGIKAENIRGCVKLVSLGRDSRCQNVLDPCLHH